MHTWSPGSFTTLDRLETADNILRKLKEKYEDSLISVAIEGSTAKGLDAPESDLELRVLLDKEYDFHRWYAFFYRNMFVGISYNSAARVLEESKEIDYEWPVSGDSIVSSTVIYDPHDIYWRLIEQSVQALQNTDFVPLLKEALTDMYEHIYKVFTIDRENSIALKTEVANIAYWCGITVGLANKVRYKSNKFMMEDSFQLKLLPPNYEQTIRKLFENDNFDEVKKNTSLIWTAFIEWSSAEFNIDLHDDGLLGI